MKPRVFGCSAFGLIDCVAKPKQEYVRSDFFLADAVLPESPFGAIKTAEEAEEERIHTGLAWPPEARVEAGAPLRRVPIPSAWKQIVDAGDRPIRWNVGSGVSFPLGKIIAEHVATVLKNAGFQDDDDATAVVAIPNHLDEFGQEAILKAFPYKKTGRVELLWRPVAVALDWLEKVQSTIQDPEEEDFILVIYFGPDDVEFTTFKLRPKDTNAGRFIIPLRERPTDVLGPTGMDWAAVIIEDTLQVGLDDPGAFWQAFTNFPEAWAAIAQAPRASKELPRPWSKGESWTLWNPDPSLHERVWSIPARESEVLQEFLRGSYKGNPSPRKEIDISWGEFLEHKLSRSIEQGPRGKLSGIAIYGPLAPSGVPPWLTASAKLLKDHGLKLDGPYDTPHLDHVWLAGNSNDPIASGARIFGTRLQKGEPTYLDTLPHLSILADRDGKDDWINLVDAAECEGGQKYNKEIEGKFSLDGRTTKIEIYLTKIDKKGPSLEKSEEAHFRKTTVQFPSVPDRDTVLDLRVQMRPASGMVQVEIIPREKEFLRGRRVFLDYSDMEHTDELPLRQLGWPETDLSEVTQEPTACTNDWAFRKFLSTPVDDTNYHDLLNPLGTSLAGSVMEHHEGKSVWLKKIDQDGKAGSQEGQRKMQEISSKLDKDFQAARKKGGEEPIRTLLIRGAWLWHGTPPSFSNHFELFLDEVLKNPKKGTEEPNWNYYVESASRCFDTPKRFKKLFVVINNRLRQPPPKKVPFPIQAERAIRNILLHRKDGQDGLDKPMASAFANKAVALIREKVEKNNFGQLFYQSLLLFLYLLRFRQHDRSFLDPNNPADKKLFETIEQAEESVEKRKLRNWENVKKTLNGIKQYMHYKGDTSLIGYIKGKAGYGNVIP